MRLCFDATRFGCGLDGAIELALARGLSAVEYSFAPFPAKGQNGAKLDAKERRYLESVAEQALAHGVEIACLNLDFCFDPQDKKSARLFKPMLTKILNVAKITGCKRVSFSAMSGSADDWLLQLEPRDERLRKLLTMVRIQGSGTSIRSVETTERDGDRTEMTITPDPG